MATSRLWPQAGSKVVGGAAIIVGVLVLGVSCGTNAARGTADPAPSTEVMGAEPSAEGDGSPDEEASSSAAIAACDDEPACIVELREAEIAWRQQLIAATAHQTDQIAARIRSHPGYEAFGQEFRACMAERGLTLPEWVDAMALDEQRVAAVQRNGTGHDALGSLGLDPAVVDPDDVGLRMEDFNRHYFGCLDRSRFLDADGQGPLFNDVVIAVMDELMLEQHDTED